jgi:hypothetical protein
MIEIGQAIISLRPGAEWTMNGDDVESIIWHTLDVEPLTLKQVDAEIKRLEQAEIDEAAAKAAARKSAEVKLAALGLTADEIAALLTDY